MPTPPRPRLRVIALCWGTLIGTPLDTLIDGRRRPRAGGVTLTSPMYQPAARRAPRWTLRRRLTTRGSRARDRSSDRGAARDAEAGGVPPENRAYFEISEDDCYRAAAAPAETINLAHFGGGNVTEAGLHRLPGPLEARPRSRRGLTLEFLPESSIADLAAAQRIVTQSPPQPGLMFDTWHFARTGGTGEQLARHCRPPHRRVQISDRVTPPGAPLCAHVRAAAAGGGRAPWSTAARPQARSRAAPSAWRFSARSSGPPDAEKAPGGRPVPRAVLEQVSAAWLQTLVSQPRAFAADIAVWGAFEYASRPFLAKGARPHAAVVAFLLATPGRP